MNWLTETPAEIDRSTREADEQPTTRNGRDFWVALLRTDGYVRGITYLHKQALRENRIR